MRNNALIILFSIGLIILCTFVIRNYLLQVPAQRALTQFLDRHLPPLEKDRKRAVLLYPHDLFAPRIVGIDTADRRLLTLPGRFAPVDYRTLSAFQDLWLVTEKGTPARTLDGSLFMIEKKARSPLFELSRLRLPPDLSFTDIAGNPGGTAYTNVCPAKGTVIAVIFTALPDGIVSATQICRDMKGREKRERSFGDTKKGTTGTIACPNNDAPTGLTFYTDKAIRGMALQCPTGGTVYDPALVPVAGRNDLPATTRTCPGGTRLRGLYGSAGALIDSVGLICGK